MKNFSTEYLRDMLKKYNRSNKFVRFIERIKYVFAIGLMPDWFKTSMELQIENNILRERLFHCKNDNNKLKKQYLDVIRCLTCDTKGTIFDIRRVTDINWNLDQFLAVQIARHIKRFKKYNLVVPASIYQESNDEASAISAWNKILDEIIFAFELSSNKLDYELTKEEKIQKRKGLQLFVDYFECLWI